jgi:hypothetical protein
MPNRSIQSAAELLNTVSKLEEAEKASEQFFSDKSRPDAWIIGFLQAAISVAVCMMKEQL